MLIFSYISLFQFVDIFSSVGVNVNSSVVVSVRLHDCFIIFDVQKGGFVFLSISLNDETDQQSV